ncbi:MAG: SDR family NAD(P)-dependent oxidoreductase [Beijerinckiaceae bacterium]
MARGHQGKVAVVTGAAGGIGQALAARLAEEGVDIAIADLKPADETIVRIEAAGRRALAADCDVSSESSVAGFASEVLAEFGQVDILVNNAGFFKTRPFAELTFADWRQTMAVNLDSMFLMTRAFLPGMRARKWGRIVNIASNSLGSVSPNHADYIASKGGVVGFTRALASEVGVDGVTVNAVSPGLTRSPGTLEGQFRPRGLPIEEAFDMISNMQAIKRHETPADLAGVVAFLTSDDAAFMTGQTLVVDGGLVRV